MLLSDVCLSVAYNGPKSRTERPRNTNIDTKIAHVTRDSISVRPTVHVQCKMVKGQGH